MPERVETLKLKDNEQSTVPYAVAGYVPRGVSADNIRQVEYELAKAHGMMNWEGDWEQGCYEKNDVVKDGEWTTIANKDTCDRPAPQPLGDVESGQPDVPSWGIASDSATIRTGSEYTFIKSGWVTFVQVWIPEVSIDIEYHSITVNKGVTTRTLLTDLVANQWNTLKLTNTPYSAGEEAGLYLQALNSGGTTQVTGGWARQADSNNNNPTLSGYNHDNNNSVLRIDKTDLDSVDRTSELLGIITNSDIQFVSTLDSNKSITYNVQTVTDSGTAVVYDVIVSSTGISGEPAVGDTTTMTATIPVPQATHWVYGTDWWLTNPPTFATVVGYEDADGVVNPNAVDNAFGVRIGFQEAYISPDWDLVSSGGSSSSSTTTSGSIGTLANHDYLEVNTIGAFPSRANIENGLIAVGYLPPYDSGQIVAVDGAKSWLVEYIQSIDKMYATKLTEI